MTSPPDKLFRQGLEHYQKPAPGSAWERIESGLEHKRNRGLWMKVAAGLVLLIATSTILFQLNQPESTIATVSKESGPVNSQQSAVSSQQSTVDTLKSLHSNPIVEGSRNNHHDSSGEDLPVGERTRAERSRSSRNEPQSKSPRSSVSSSERSADPAKGAAFVAGPQSAVTTQNTISPDESNLSSSNDPVEKMTESKSASQATITNEISIADAAADSKRTSITYSAEEVNAKYLKKESVTEATPEKKNTSGLQKVIDLALDLKNEGSVLGDIREKKNEWLSINIPSNKRETNK
ncbi:MAG TPA: hypothetical protein VLA46_09775 [Saprospiraceae bacterium]|nr:hypothetical protein [Saprospiraceae bacterium]